MIYNFLYNPFILSTLLYLLSYTLIRHNLATLKTIKHLRISDVEFDSNIKTKTEFLLEHFYLVLKLEINKILLFSCIHKYSKNYNVVKSIA